MDCEVDIYSLQVTPIHIYYVHIYVPNAIRNGNRNVAYLGILFFRKMARMRNITAKNLEKGPKTSPAFDVLVLEAQKVEPE